ncbi:hypothetical protein FHT86_007125 [Rhizobium sp. BK313]|nr:hypothetical protein [Rhizobium sp. BK313]MBB3458799.1 hypothetical protein [Rhizobium sp. BK313]
MSHVASIAFERRTAIEALFRKLERQDCAIAAFPSKHGIAVLPLAA